MNVRRTHIGFCIAILVLLANTASWTDEGRIEEVVVHSAALEGNLLGDSADRGVAVYLPPGYDEEPTRLYPVVYNLAGFGGVHDAEAEWYAPELSAHMSAGTIRPMIVVFIDGTNHLGGSNYANSSVAGGWEDFVAVELVEYIDAQYRTIPAASSRGLSGYSMGAGGAMTLAIKHADTFSAVYSTKAFMKLPHGHYTAQWKTLIKLVGWDASVDNAMVGTGLVYPFTVAWTPNPDNGTPFVDLPYELVDGELQPVEPTYSRLAAAFPVGVLREYADSAARLRGIAFIGGTSDLPGLLASSRAMSQALSEAGIDHQFEEVNGDHSPLFPEQWCGRAMQFLSDTLADEAVPSAVGSRSWGAVKNEAGE